MTTAAEPGQLELTPEDILTIRGAANVAVELIDHPSIEIDDQLDPLRRDHIAAAGGELAEIQGRLSDDGTWRGWLKPVEQQGLRDALGAVESMISPPKSARIDSIDYRATDDELAVLDAALDKIPAPDREDLAYSDLRYGPAIGVLSDRVPLYEPMEDGVRRALAGIDRDTAGYRATMRDSGNFGPIPDDADCDFIDQTVLDLALEPALNPSEAPPRLIPEVRDRIETRLETDCYRDMDRRRIRAAVAQLTERAERRESVGTDVFAVAEMLGWAKSNRLREQKIGLR